MFFASPPYFDNDAFMHYALHVLDAHAAMPTTVTVVELTDFCNLSHSSSKACSSSGDNKFSGNS